MPMAFASWYIKRNANQEIFICAEARLDTALFAFLRLAFPGNCRGEMVISSTNIIITVKFETSKSECIVFVKKF